MYFCVANRDVIMNALHFGAGKIGRGFIGALLRQSGYALTFVDAQREVVDAINHHGGYSVHIVGDTQMVERIEGVTALISGSEDVLERFVEADVVTTAVSMNRLGDVAEVVARGLEKRATEGVIKPLNIICCENGIRATSQLRALVAEIVDLSLVGQGVGFVDCCVDRIVPNVKMDRLLDVAVEPYFEWCVDRKAVVGELPNLPATHFVDDIDGYIFRKLFTLNTAHCTTAYLGALKGYQFIHQAIIDEGVRSIVEGVMGECSRMVVKRYGFALDEQRAYCCKVLERFANPHLGDTVRRVAGDPIRKLSPKLYFSTPISTLLQLGEPISYLTVAVAAALHFRSIDDVQSMQLAEMVAKDGVERSVREICKIDDDAVISQIAEHYQRINDIF